MGRSQIEIVISQTVDLMFALRDLELKPTLDGSAIVVRIDKCDYQTWMEVGKIIQRFDPSCNVVFGEAK